MKKTFPVVAMIALCLMGMTGCSKADKKAPASKNASAKSEKGVTIAFVDLDSLMAHYQYYLDCSKTLEQKSEKISNDLNNKAVALQKEMAEAQDKYQKGQLTQEQASQLQVRLQNKQTQLQNQQQSYSEAFQKEQAKYNKALHDSIDNFLQSYNKTAGFTYILSRSNDNILLADPKYDITEEVISGLNKRYKKK